MDHSWSLCICGDVKKVFAVYVKVSNTVAELKKAIHGKSLIPVDEQSLYFQEQLMRDDLVLSSISGLYDGAMVYQSRRPPSLNFRSLMTDNPEDLQIKLSHDELEKYPVSYLKDIICDRIGAGTPSILVCRGEILDESAYLSQYPAAIKGAKIILQKAPIAVEYTGRVNFKIYTSQGTRINFIKQQLSYKTGISLSRIECGAYVSGLEEKDAQKSNTLQFRTGYLSKKEDERIYSNIEVTKRDGWILDVQRLDGIKISVHVFEEKNMPIVKLKECVEECTGVPTHQQRLTVGDTILEDWDKEDRMMFIGDYPTIQHGTLLYLIQLEGGFRMIVGKKDFFGWRNSFLLKLVKKSQLALLKSGEEKEYCYQTSYFYVNSIEDYNDLVNKVVARKRNTFSRSGCEATIDRITDDKGGKVSFIQRVGPNYKIHLTSQKSPMTICW